MGVASPNLAKDLSILDTDWSSPLHDFRQARLSLPRLCTPSRMEKQAGPASLPTSIRPFPLSGPAHCRRGRANDCGSLGSNSSIPEVIEDQGSDVSAEDEYATGAALWDSCLQDHSHGAQSIIFIRPQYTALVDTPARGYNTPIGGTASPGQNRHLAVGRTSCQEGRRDQPLGASPESSPRHRRPQMPKPVSYSLFPLGAINGRPSVPPRRSCLPKITPNTVTYQNVSQPSSNTRDCPMSPVRNPAALALDSISARNASTPLLAISLPPVIPEEPSQTSSCEKPLLDLPRPLTATHRPTISKFSSLSNISTRSTSALAQLAQSQAQCGPINTTRRTAELPPLPRCFSAQPSLSPEELSSPPNKSVFEDPDDEESDNTTGGDESSTGFARKLIRGLVLVRSRDGPKGKESSHQRSASDHSEFNIGSSSCCQSPRSGIASPAMSRRPFAFEINEESPELRRGSGRTEGSSKAGASSWLKRNCSSEALSRILGRRST
ncbi:hypothetical protein B0H63DRAFT_5643 [Podospora didyma]|uniref:Uncharacterized protein n=1 Tax=Podospora didyma TaxID=330526 RepID=A0AAE0P435_9PEZI|nr:hypothetical protein B0H63DRAFT_5643 [Podospora didyma]